MDSGSKECPDISAIKTRMTVSMKTLHLCIFFVFKETLNVNETVCCLIFPEEIMTSLLFSHQSQSTWSNSGLLFPRQIQSMSYQWRYPYLHIVQFVLSNTLRVDPRSWTLCSSAGPDLQNGHLLRPDGQPPAQWLHADAVCQPAHSIRRPVFIHLHQPAAIPL